MNFLTLFAFVAVCLAAVLAQEGGGGRFIWPNFADPRVRHERDAKPPTGGLQQQLREEREPDVGLESPEL